jgi:chitosanase
MLTDLQIKAAQTIVNIFETGKPRGEYGQVTLLPGDSGHLTYGRSQTTLASGNLFLLIKSCCSDEAAAYADELEGYLDRLADCDLSLDHNMKLRRLLHDAGGDSVMQAVQDGFFDRVYWAPATQAAGELGIDSGLGVGVVYDSFIHGSWRRMRDRTIERHGSVASLGAQSWVERYVEVRREWLANHPNRLLHRTVYRMDSFRGLIAEGKWDLALPFTVRGIVIDEWILSAGAGPRADSGEVEPRMIRLKAPYMEGDDVRALQQALKATGLKMKVDGIYGPDTEAAVRTLQAEKGLGIDGIVGQATRSAIGF